MKYVALVAVVVGLTGCANQRQNDLATGAVLGGIAGYVIRDSQGNQQPAQPAAQRREHKHDRGDDGRDRNREEAHD